MSLLIKHGVGTGRISPHLGQPAQGLPFIAVLGFGSSPEDSQVRLLTGETSQVLQGSGA